MQHGLCGDAASNGPSCGPGSVKGHGRPQSHKHVPHRYGVACKGSRLPSEWIYHWSGGPHGPPRDG
ncbi:Hypothetical protein FKW44_011901 [Caligus rogercresseyi]|uniref:Uncharacterized protein n=1 Tax=Caligus rogercresseyi TaxID=217165 RepID=A0A7T8HIM3_CALRO|nr:Hypothetical protein FKW44_011901 [Caligus rogercresseyi]